MWNQFAMGQIFGYKVDPENFYKTLNDDGTLRDINNYQIYDGVSSFNKEAYGTYNTMFVIGYLPALLIVSPPLADFNKKVIVGAACTLWGAIMFMHSLATTATMFYILAFSLGICQGSIESSLYSLLGKLFAPQYRQRAYVIYSFIGLLYEPMKFMIASLISAYGWKDTWKFIGGCTMGAGVLFLVTVFEPTEGDLSHRCNCPIKFKQLTDEAQRCLANNGLHAVVSHKANRIIIRPKPKTLSDIVADYKLGASLVFTNFWAVMVIFGFFCKQTNGTVQQLYLNYFFS